MPTASSSKTLSPAKSPRVCLNCRRKKKGCDKALPTCRRCKASLENCRYGQDQLLTPTSPDYQRSFGLDAGSRGGLNTPQSTLFASGAAGPPQQQQWSGPLSPSLFRAVESGEESVDAFAYRCLADAMDDAGNMQQQQRQQQKQPLQQAVEGAVAEFYARAGPGVAAIVDRNRLAQQLQALWTRSPGSTEVIALVFSLLSLANKGGVGASPDPVNVRGGGVGGGGGNGGGASRSRGGGGSGTRRSGRDASRTNSAYLSAKTLLSFVQSQLPPSTSLLQAELLLAVYECSHGMPQQAWMTTGRCFQMTRTLGWHDEGFWMRYGGQQAQDIEAEWAVCSVIWRSLCSLDSRVQLDYPDQKYPRHHAAGVQANLIAPAVSSSSFFPCMAEEDALYGPPGRHGQQQQQQQQQQQPPPQNRFPVSVAVSSAGEGGGGLEGMMLWPADNINQMMLGATSGAAVMQNIVTATSSARALVSPAAGAAQRSMPMSMPLSMPMSMPVSMPMSMPMTWPEQVAQFEQRLEWRRAG